MPESHRTAGSPGRTHASTAPEARQETVGGILGVEPDLDGVSGCDNVGLTQRQYMPRGHHELLADQVESGDRLGHRVLPTWSRVLTSRKKNSPDSSSTRNSTVPADS